MIRNQPPRRVVDRLWKLDMVAISFTMKHLYDAVLFI